MHEQRKNRKTWFVWIYGPIRVSWKHCRCPQASAADSTHFWICGWEKHLGIAYVKRSQSQAYQLPEVYTLEVCSLTLVKKTRYWTGTHWPITVQTLIQYFPCCKTSSLCCYFSQVAVLCRYPSWTFVERTLYLKANSILLLFYLFSQICV